MPTPPNGSLKRRPILSDWKSPRRDRLSSRNRRNSSRFQRLRFFSFLFRERYDGGGQGEPLKYSTHVDSNTRPLFGNMPPHDVLTTSIPFYYCPPPCFSRAALNRFGESEMEGAGLLAFLTLLSRIVTRVEWRKERQRILAACHTALCYSSRTQEASKRQSKTVAPKRYEIARRHARFCSSRQFCSFRP